MICPRKDQCMHVQVNISQYIMTVYVRSAVHPFYMLNNFRYDIVIDRKEQNSINK